jgi:hypothetical protein
MTMPEPRPEPVLAAGSLTAKIVGVVGAVMLVLVATGVLTQEEATSTGDAISALAIAVSTVVGVLVPLWQTRKARAKVTPLAAPRDADGVALVRSDRGDL